MDDNAGIDITSDQLSSEVASLIELGDIDTEIDKLRHGRIRLSERTVVSQLTQQLEAVRKDHAAMSADRDERVTHLEELARLAAVATDRARAIEATATGHDAPSFRDQEAMALEIAALASQASDLEDIELDEMEQIERIDKLLTKSNEEIASLEDKYQVALAALRQVEHTIDSDLERLATRRKVVVGEIGSPWIEEYESLRSHLGDTGVARLVRGTCSGCHLHLSAIELDQIRQRGPSNISHCEQCGRILIP